MSARLEPFRGTNQTIERVAEKFRERFDIPPAERIASSGSLIRLVHRTGGEVSVLDSPTSHEADGGSLVIFGPHRYSIYLSPYTTPLRDNFTIGHEIGHFLLHYTARRDDLTADLPIVFTRYGTGLTEWQANRFSAALLMPEAEFERQFRDLGGDVELLAGRFGVSVPAATNRCKSLGLMSND